MMTEVLPNFVTTTVTVFT